MPNRRSPKKLEEKLAKQYAFQHSIRTTGQRKNIIEVKETVYTGTPEALVQAVLVGMQGIQRTSEILEVPQGLILSDSRGEGFFDINI